MKQFNKKGAVDTADFLYLVLFGFFLMVFLMFMLSLNVKNSDDKAVAELEQVKDVENEISNLRIDAYEGKVSPDSELYLNELESKYFDEEDG
jgi:hypothetical protein